MLKNPINLPAISSKIIRGISEIMTTRTDLNNKVMENVTNTNPKSGRTAGW